MRIILALCALIAAALAPASAQAAARDWTRTAAVTPAGAFVIGNPAAKVKLVEYLSMTCPHCAHFSAEAWPPLKAKYVARGLVSIEVRHAVRDGFDLAASLLVRCGGPRSFLAATEAVLAGQEQWYGRTLDAPDSLQGLPISQRLIAMARLTGLDTMFVKRGIPARRVAACLSSAPEQKLLALMTDEAWNKREIGGTPTFLINDKVLEGVSTWAGLEPLIQAALK